VPFQNYNDGLYLVKQRSQNKPGIEHYGILDIGNRLGHPKADGINPTVVHQTPPQLRVDWLAGTGNWEVLGKITDEQMARQRVKQAANQPHYDLFGHNCEQFARFIATGKHESTQFQSAAVIGLAALAIYAFR
jgi:hypothetical protein